MFSAIPSSDDMPGVHDLNINSPPQSRAGAVRSSSVQMSSRANWQSKPKLRLRPPLMLNPNPQRQALPHPRSTATAGTAENVRRPENTSGDGSPVDVAMGLGSANSDEGAMAEGAARTGSRTARRLRRSGMVAGMAQDAYCTRGSLTLWAVRTANHMLD